MPVRSNRYFQVVATYVRRPVFRALAAAVVTYYLFVVIREHRREPWWKHWHSYDYLINYACHVFPLPFMIISIAALLAHVREQLATWRGALISDYIRPHLVVAAATFVGLCAAATLWQFRDSYGYVAYWPPGVLAVVLTLMTVSAWASVFRSSWFSLLLVPVFLCALLMNRHTEHLVDQIMIGSHYYDYKHQRWTDLSMPPWIPATTAALLLFDICMLATLGRHLARSARSEGALGQRLRRVLSAPADAWQSSASLPQTRPHRMTHGLLRRAWCRRVPAITPGAPWWMAAAVTGLISSFYLIFNRELLPAMQRAYSAEISMPILFATIVPAVAVAITWRERYSSFGYESLFPARRAEFSIELALAMAVDLAEYWLAAMLATLLPQLCFSIAVLNYTAFSFHLLAPPIVASAMMQFLALGTIFWISRQRSFMAVGLAIVCLLLATTIPFQLSWADSRPISTATLLTISSIEMAVGFALTAFGFVVWKTGDLA